MFDFICAAERSCHLFCRVVIELLAWPRHYEMQSDRMCIKLVTHSEVVAANANPIMPVLEKGIDLI